LDCLDCFASYFELIEYFRFLNIDYREIKILFYNIIEREILRIVTYNDNDEEYIYIYVYANPI